MALLFALTYAAVILGVALTTRASEMAKISRGVFSDTFSPTLPAELATWPASLVVDDRLPTYPLKFDRVAYRRVVNERIHRLTTVGLLQVLIVTFTLVLVKVAIFARRERGGPTTRPLPRSSE